MTRPRWYRLPRTDDPLVHAILREPGFSPDLRTLALRIERLAIADQSRRRYRRQRRAALPGPDA